MKLKLFYFFLFLFSVYGFSQQYTLSKNAEISVLTIGPGYSLNDAFGHNAFRVKDNTLRIDAVYGYGEYDFDAPNFYLKFAQGKLNYLISRHRFSDIFRYYSKQNRSIKEQVLNLSTEEKQRLFNYLENNYKPENRKYLYDFFFDNCATKIRDVSQIASKNTIVFTPPENYEQKTFRELIYEHVNRNSWGSFGIDVALGSVVDIEANEGEFMFLPKYIHSFFEVAKIKDGNNFVKSSSTLYEKRPENVSSNFLFSPLFVFSLVAIFIFYITYRDFKNSERTKWLDIFLFSITGLVGLVLLLLWFATDHSATVQNYNVLWACPLNLLVMAQLFKKQTKNWFRAYLRFLIIMLCLLTLHWLIGVQVFAIALMPFLISLVFRYLYLVKFYGQR